MSRVPGSGAARHHARGANGKIATKQWMTDDEVVETVRSLGSQKKAAEHYDVPRQTFALWYRKAMAKRLVDKPAVAPVKIKKPAKGAILRYIFSSVQDGTNLDEQFLTNLEAYAKHMDADLRIAGFTYNKSTYGHKDKDEDALYHERVMPYLCEDRIDVGGKLLFCGEMNTLPTATHPLSGFETYTRSCWGVFPHPRVSLTSVATMFKDPAKLIMTTGTVSLPNYIHKKAGLKAEFHHVIGALLVEMDDQGNIFCRHLLAEKDSSFQDLTMRVDNGVVTGGHTVEAITWGDIHTEMLDPEIARMNWGIGIRAKDDTPIVDALRPKFQFFHDVADFRARCHHNIRDPHFMYEMFVNGTESVVEACQEMANFLIAAGRDYAESVVVESNHDKMLVRWLREADYRYDPVNAEFFLDCQKAVYGAIKSREADFSIFEHVMRRLGDGLDDVTFLRETSTFRICPSAGGGIECSLHGHKGANGAKGHINSFAKMGPKANVCHTHSAAIFEGIYQGGTSSKLDLGYNKGGLSSWNHSDIVTYKSGKRIILTKMNGKAWA